MPFGSYLSGDVEFQFLGRAEGYCGENLDANHSLEGAVAGAVESGVAQNGGVKIGCEIAGIWVHILT